MLNEMEKYTNNPISLPEKQKAKKYGCSYSSKKIYKNDIHNESFLTEKKSRQQTPKDIF